MHGGIVQRLSVGAIGIAAAALLVLVPEAAAQVELPDGFSDGLVVSGLDQPASMAFLPDGRLLVTERASARIRMVANHAFGNTDPIIVVDSVEAVFLERGLLGIAVDPGWPARPYVYVLYDAVDRTIRISRYRANGDLASPGSGNLALDPASRYDVIRDLPDSADAHNGGTIRFGADGMLLASLGEDTNPCAAQDTTSLRGVLLRLNVADLPDGPGGPPDRAQLTAAGNPFVSHPHPNARLIWALGLRNPFRFHVDPADGAVFVADVGQSMIEEVSRIDAPGSNLGWPWMEGHIVLNPGCPGGRPAPLQAPIYGYDRSGFVLTGAASIVSAGVYRGGSCGCRFPDEYLGDYFLADFYEGIVRRLDSAGGWHLAAPVAGQPSTTNWARGLVRNSDYLFGPDGTLWYLRFCSPFVLQQTGEVRRIIYTPSQLEAPGVAVRGVTFAAPYPTPTKGAVRFFFALERPGEVQLDVYDAAGRWIERILPPERRAAGRHAATWSRNVSDLPPAGIYLVRLVVDGEAHVRRIVLTP